MSSEELELIALIAGGDKKAYDRFYKTYYRAIYRTAYKFVQDSDDAYEMTHRIFVNVWIDREELLAVETSLEGWLVTKTRFATLMFLRKEGHRAKAEKEHADYLQLTHDSAVDDLYKDSLRAQLEAALRKLPFRQEQIYRMHKQEMLPAATIAQKLGIEESTVYTSIKKAKKNLDASLSAQIPSLLLVAIVEARHLPLVETMFWN